MDETTGRAPEEESPEEQAPAEDARKRPERSLLHYLGVSLSAALLLLVIGLAVVSIVVPKVAGGIPLTVLTNSMAPGMPPGTLAIVVPVDPDDVGIGDVVTYQVRSGDPTVITHRVIGATQPDAQGEREFFLQGDNNASPDPDPVREVQIQGEVWYSIPLLGWVNSAMNGDDRPWLVAALAGALFVYAAWMVVSAVRDGVRRRRAREDDAAIAGATSAPRSADPPRP